jgi:hypothetical protein
MNNFNYEDETFNASEEEFSYLRFDVDRFINQDDFDSQNPDATQKEVDITDYSYLKFDVTKYARDDENRAGE